MNELPAELVDIVEPAQMATQGSQNALVLVAAIVLVISVLAVLRWWLQNKDRRRTLRRLRHLRHEFSAGRVTSRVLAYAIAAELRTRLQTTRLHPAHPIGARDDTQRDAWRDFIARLDTLRYQPGMKLDSAHVDVMVRAAIYWARRSR